MDAKPKPVLMNAETMSYLEQQKPDMLRILMPGAQVTYNDTDLEVVPDVVGDLLG